jgi:hypothetical protein
VQLKIEIVLWMKGNSKVLISDLVDHLKMAKETVVH